MNRFKSRTALPAWPKRHSNFRTRSFFSELLWNAGTVAGETPLFVPADVRKNYRFEATGRAPQCPCDLDPDMIDHHETNRTQTICSSITTSRNSHQNISSTHGRILLANQWVARAELFLCQRSCVEYTAASRACLAGGEMPTRFRKSSCLAVLLYLISIPPIWRL